MRIHTLRALCAAILGGMVSSYALATPPSTKMVRMTVDLTHEQAFLALLERGDAEGMAHLMEHEFDVNAQLENGATPLVMTILSVPTIGSNALEIAKLLVKEGALIDTPVMINGQTLTPAEIVELLQKELDAFTQAPETSAEQSALAHEALRVLMMIKRQVLCGEM